MIFSSFISGAFRQMEALWRVAKPWRARICICIQMDSLSEKGRTSMLEGIDCVLELPQDDVTYLLLEEESRWYLLMRVPDVRTHTGQATRKMTARPPPFCLSRADLTRPAS
jgi:hypothetical protein